MVDEGEVSLSEFLIIGFFYHIYWMRLEVKVIMPSWRLHLICILSS